MDYVKTLIKKNFSNWDIPKLDFDDSLIDLYLKDKVLLNGHSASVSKLLLLLLISAMLFFIYGIGQ